MSSPLETRTRSSRREGPAGHERNQRDARLIAGALADRDRNRLIFVLLFSEGDFLLACARCDWPHAPSSSSSLLSCSLSATSRRCFCAGSIGAGTSGGRPGTPSRIADAD